MTERTDEMALTVDVVKMPEMVALASTVLLALQETRVDLVVMELTELTVRTAIMVATVVLAPKAEMAEMVCQAKMGSMA